MQVVIEIPNRIYKIIQNRMLNITDAKIVEEAVRNGKTLPKGHGDLIDKGKLKKWIETQNGDKLMTEYYLDALDTQETILGGSHDGDAD